MCDEIFQRKLELEASGKVQLQVTFSMMEIYNEKIRDLLNPDAKTNNDLKVPWARVASSGGRATQWGPVGWSDLAASQASPPPWASTH